MSFTGFLAVGGGAAAGAWLRWLLGTAFNSAFPALPLGTLAANLIGGYLMGIAMGFMAHYETMSPEMRLLVTTGFLGGLTTFSSFSAETVTLIARNEYGWTALLVVAHVAGSILLTLAGIETVRLLVRP